MKTKDQERVSMKLMKKKNKLYLLVVAMSIFVNFPVLASSGSIGELSFIFFIWFGIIGWIVSWIVKRQLEKKEDNIFNRIRILLPYTLLISPTLYIESSGGMLLPSAAAFVFSIDPINVTSLISCIISIILTTLAVYAYKYKKDINIQELNEKP